MKGEKVVSKSAPFKQAGQERQQDLLRLYGQQAAHRIHLMETELQMKFDKNYDVYQPKYWPSFPLKLKF